MDQPTAQAEQFRAMHHGSALLVLPNAWDAITARIFEAVGFRAIATTSVGIAVALGYRDGNTPCSEMVQAVGRIAHAVKVPVTADIESGYGDDIQQTVNNVARFLDVGIVGINLEDATGQKTDPIASVSEQVKKIQAIRRMADSRNLPLVINARTDVMHLGGHPHERLMEETFRRAQAYRDAGADCIYVFGQLHPSTIAQLSHGIDGPINIVAGPHTPPIAELQQMGVARLSIGGGAVKAAMGLVKQIGQNLLAGSYPDFSASLSNQELNGYFPG